MTENLASPPAPFVFTPRPAQARVLEYEHGPMGISAVPGSGKTFTLSLLAARLVKRLANAGNLDEAEVLVVTFTNSAVDNFRSRIGRFLQQEQGLLPGVGYRVRTLHGLAHDIVRERPALAGLSENFDIIDERTSASIKRDSVIGYLRANPDAFGAYIKPELLQNYRSIEQHLIKDAIDLAERMIRIAKELRLEPHQLQGWLRRQSGSWPLLEFGCHIYADYQRSLLLRGAVDFDDLIVLALTALDADENYLQRLQQRYPYVLEDEAQDSSALQEEMLRRLTAAHGNWVRVGDPNQAINTTFTGADTRFLQRFLAAHPEQSRELPNSGRSAQPIIDLANALIDWSANEHPVLPADLALTRPHIVPTPADDPQQNPPPGVPPVHLYERAMSPEDEVDVVVRSLERWLSENPEKTVAVLAPENNHGIRVTELLASRQIPFDDNLLRSDSNTRAGAQVLAHVLHYVSKPQLMAHLQTVWSQVWWPMVALRITPEDNGMSAEPGAADANPARKIVLPAPVKQFAEELGRLRRPEDFLFPSARDWLEQIRWLDEDDMLREQVGAFRRSLQRWAQASVLPVDELLITLGNDLFVRPADLALTHRLAVLLAKLGRENPGWRLPELAGELEAVALNKRRLLGFNEEGMGYEPRPGVVTVGTMHAAKGLEWDRVYLMAVNNYSFPSGEEGDKYRSERWYVRDNLNLTAEAEAQLRQLQRGSLDDYVAGPATQQARLDVAAERLRLLYVGITRARRELIITYNTGRNHEKDPNPPALAFRVLSQRLRG